MKKHTLERRDHRTDEFARSKKYYTPSKPAREAFKKLRQVCPEAATAMDTYVGTSLLKELDAIRSKNALIQEQINTLVMQSMDVQPPESPQ